MTNDELRATIGDWAEWAMWAIRVNDIRRLLDDSDALAVARAEVAAALTLIREHGYGTNSPDLDDAIRQMLQSSILNSGTVARLQKELADAQARTKIAYEIPKV